MTIQAALPVKDEDVFKPIFTQYQKSTTSIILLKFTCNNYSSYIW